MAEFPNFRRKYSPSALMQGVQQQNQRRYMSPAITPNAGMGNAQGRISALAPAAGMSTSNPTGAQTMGPANKPGAFTQQDYDEYMKQQTGVPGMPGAQNLLNVKVPEHLKQFAPSGKPQTLPYQMPAPGTQPSATVPVEFLANGAAPASAPVTTPQSRTAIPYAGMSGSMGAIPFPAGGPVPAQPLLSRSPATGAAVGSPLPYGRPGEVVTQELVSFEEDFGNRLAEQNGQQAAAPGVAPSAIPSSGRAPGPIMQPAEAPGVYAPLRTNQAGQPMYPFARYDQNRPGAELMVDSFTTDRNNPDIRWGEVSPEHRPTGWAPRAVDTNPEISSASPPPVTTPQSRTPSMPGGQAPRASALSGIDMSPRFTNALSPYDGAGAGSAGGSGSGNLGMSPAPASPPAASVLTAPTNRTSPIMQQDAGGYENMNPLFTGGPESGNMFQAPAEPSTADRLRAAGRGEGPNAQEGMRRDNNNYNRAYDEQYQGIQRGVGITEEERANWTPERGYGFAPSAVQSAASGGAIGSGMRKRFGQGGYFNPSEEDAGPQRRMSDAESMKKMGIIQGAIGPDGRRLGFSKIDQAIARGDTATADRLKQEQDAIRERNFARREALRGVNGGKTRDELRREKRANSALSRGRITKEEYNNVVTRNDEAVERRSALRDAGIPVRGDRGFDAIDRANAGMAGSRPSALATTVVPNNAVTGSTLPRADVQQKAREDMKALTDPNSVMAPANTPKEKMRQNESAAIQGLGVTAEDSLHEINRKVTTMSTDSVTAMLKDEESTRAFIIGLKRAYMAQKNTMERDDFKGQIDEPTAKHWEALESIPDNDLQALQQWWSKLYHDAEKKRKQAF